MTVQRVILQGAPEIEVDIIRRARVRRMSLRVSQVDRGVRLTVPTRLPEREAMAFLAEKEAWLRGALDALPSHETVGFGTRLPIYGEMRDIVRAPGKRIALHATEVQIPGGSDQVGARLAAYLKAEARLVLQRRAQAYSDDLGRPFGRISIRDTRSRWGSCSSDGNLNFSWRLIMAPPEVLDYVAAHEVAHLAEMNHSPAFWSVVHQLFGPYEAERTWLRKHGAELHKYRFKSCS